MPVSDQSDAIDVDDLQTWRIFPVPNSHAAAAIAVLLLYSAVFLFYAQYHFVIMLVMTSIIAIFISILYATGLAYVFYLMMRLKAIEQSSDGDANDSDAYVLPSSARSSAISAELSIASASTSLTQPERISVVRIACGDYVFPYGRPIQVSEVKL